MPTNPHVKLKDTKISTKAYILIETSVGETKRICDTLKSIDAVVELDPVTGPYDIIATISSNDLPSIGQLVTDYIHTIPGIVRTVTCLSLA